jgi:hypothetical protein
MATVKDVLLKEIPMHGKIVVVEVSYSLGGMNYFTYKTEKRGYYLHVRPEERGNGIRKFTAFSGVKKLMLEVSRQSPKKLQEAVDLVTPELIDAMIAQCKFD